MRSACSSPPHSAGLDIGQNLLQVPNSLGQGLHLSELFVDVLKLFSDLTEGVFQSGIERVLKLLIHGLPQLLKALLVIRADFGKLAFDGLGEFLVVRRELCKAGVHEGVQLGASAVQAVEAGACDGLRLFNSPESLAQRIDIL